MIERIKSYWPWMLLLAGLPLAAFGLLLIPNEYESWGGAGVDCDGPFLLVFSIPAIVLYLICIIAFARRCLLTKTWPSFLAFTFSIVLFGFLTANSIAAFKELRLPDHRESCA
jgi:hypothetical protein